jgi:hypothetical protein
MEDDVEQRGSARFFVNYMGGPDFLAESFHN